MKEIVEYMKEQGLICKTLKEVKPKEIGSRKRIKLYLGVDLKGYFCLIMILNKKSRVLRKEVKELIEIHKKIEVYHHAKIKKKYILIEAPLCSHAKMMFIDNDWSVWHQDEVYRES